ncbi:MAG: hypothetical protein OEV08_02320 [Nitrospira sp.]|nr:hypothetical protein [Nitrospira sp.]
MTTLSHVSVRADRVVVGDIVARLESLVPELSERFYQRFFELAPAARSLFKGSDAFRQRKFANLFITFRSLEYLERVVPVLAEMGKRHRVYHRQFHMFMLPMKQALLETLETVMGSDYTADVAKAWESVYDDVAAIMIEAVRPADVERRSETRAPWSGPERRASWSVREDQGLLQDVGGADMVRRVHEAFYNVLFEDAWLGQFFYGKSKPVLIQKQTEFMVSAFGGPHAYSGATPAFVHMNMFVTEELAALRERYLRRAILSQGLSESIADRWLAVDRLYRPAIVKPTVEDCVVTCFGQFPVEAKKPVGYREPDDLR